MNKIHKSRMILPFERAYNDVKLYGTRVKELREERRETCREVANNIGISHAIITKIENGSQRRVNLKHLELLSEYFGCPYMYLLGKSDSRTYYKENILYINPDDGICLEDVLHQTRYLAIEQTIDSLKEIVLEKIVRCYVDENNKRDFTIQYERDNSFEIRTTSITRSAKDNCHGVRITIGGDVKIYFYYLKKGNFKADLASYERTIADIDELRKKRNSEYIIQQMVQRKDIKDFLVVQECRNYNSPVMFIDPTRNTTHRYQKMLNEVFYKHNTFNIKNIPVIELLHALPHYRDNEIIKLFVRILRMEEFYEKNSEKNKYGRVTMLMSDYLELFLKMEYEDLKECYEEIKKKYRNKF